MAIDLSSLEEATALPSPTGSRDGGSGQPMRIPLSDIEEDPNQPRKEFPQEKMAEMVASIKATGVKTPVSLRVHPSKAGKYILNYGARRFRGSVEAGVKDIPAFIDQAHTDYDQVIENLQREDLTAMEMALFIARKLKDGDKKQTIAKRLGKSPDIVTFHLALIDAPPLIEDAYTSGKCTSARTLYQLRAVYEKHPEGVEAWYENAPEITRGAVDDLTAGLKGGKKAGKTPDNFAMSKSAGEGGDGDKGDLGQGTGRSDGQGTGSQHQASSSANTNAPSSATGKASPDPYQLKKPVLLVEFNKQEATVLLNRAPSAPGLLRIRLTKSGDDIEVDADMCKIRSLMEGG